MSTNDKCCERDKELLSKDTISEILGVKIPNKFFTFKITNKKSLTLDFDPKVFLKLKSTQKDRCFSQNSLQNLFLDGIKKSNPYCYYL